MHSVVDSAAYFAALQESSAAEISKRPADAPKVHFRLFLSAVDKGGGAAGALQPPTPRGTWQLCTRRTTSISVSAGTLALEIRLKLTPDFTDATDSMILWYNNGEPGGRYRVEVIEGADEISMPLIRAYAASLDKLRGGPAIVLNSIVILMVSGRPSDLGLLYSKRTSATSPEDCPASALAYSNGWSNTYFQEFAVDHMLQLSHLYTHLAVILRKEIQSLRFAETLPLVVQSLKAAYVVSNNHRLLNGTHRVINDLRCWINHNIWFQQTIIEEQLVLVKPKRTQWGVKVRTELLKNAAVRQTTAKALAYSAVTGAGLFKKMAAAKKVNANVAAELVRGCEHLLTMYTAPARK